MFYFDPWLLIVTAPAILLMMWAQYRLRSTYTQGMQVGTPLTGAAAALHILESEGVTDVAIEETHGHLSDHYDPRDRVVRLSSEVFHSRSATAVGIAAHEAGTLCSTHMDTSRWSCETWLCPPHSSAGTAFTILVLLAFFLRQPQFLLFGIIAYSATVVFS